jgi:hypothetical protein
MQIVAQIMKKFSDFHETVFHKSTLLNPILNKRNPIYILYSFPLRCILIFCSHQRKLLIMNYEIKTVLNENTLVFTKIYVHTMADKNHKHTNRHIQARKRLPALVKNSIPKTVSRR